VASPRTCAANPAVGKNLEKREGYQRFRLIVAGKSVLPRRPSIYLARYFHVSREWGKPGEGLEGDAGLNVFVEESGKAGQIGYA
jgi:hypothetical protein